MNNAEAREYVMNWFKFKDEVRRVICAMSKARVDLHGYNPGSGQPFIERQFNRETVEYQVFVTLFPWSSGMNYTVQVPLEYIGQSEDKIFEIERRVLEEARKQEAKEAETQREKDKEERRQLYLKLEEEFGVPLRRSDADRR